MRVTLAAPANAMVGSTWAIHIPTAVGNTASTAAPTMVLVPLRAVVPGAQAGQGHVLRLAQDGKTTERVDVTLGAPARRRWVHVAQGLTSTDRVVLAGAAHLQPGTAILPVAPTGASHEPVYRCTGAPALPLLTMLALVLVRLWLALEPSTEEPPVTIRTATVLSMAPGANVERMEQLIARPTEESILGLPEVKRVKTTVRPGFA